MSENSKKKQKAKANSLKKLVESNNRFKNRVIYNKTSYNQNVVAILLIVSKKKYNFSFFQKLTSKIVAAIRSLYNLMSKLKKTQYLTQTQKLLNFEAFDYIDQSFAYFHVWVVRFLARSSLDNKNLKFSIEWFSRKSTSTKKLLEKISKKADLKKINKSLRSFLIFNQSSRRFAFYFHSRSKDSYLNQKFFRYSRQKRRARFDLDLNMKSKRNQKIYNYQFKY